MKAEHFLIAGCGYIGKKVASLLQQLQHDTFCLVHSDSSLHACASMGLQAASIDLDQIDASLPNSLQTRLQDSAILYTIAPPPRGREDQRMAHFIRLLQASSATPSRIVLISTTGIYGDCQGEWIDESAPVEPQADRAYRRVDAEQKLTQYCEQRAIPLIILRVPGIYGADKLPIKRITSGEPIVRAEDSGFTNRIHAQDLAAFCCEALLNERIPSGVYNCCDGHPSTMNDYFSKVAEALGLPQPPQISLQEAQQTLSAGMLSYLAESKRISNSKLLKHFNTRFTYPDLDAGLRDVETLSS